MMGGLVNDAIIFAWTVTLSPSLGLFNHFFSTPVSFGTSTVQLLRGETHANIQARPRLSMTMWVQKSSDCFRNVCRLEDKIAFHVPETLADSRRVSVFYNKEMCTVPCVKDVVITPTIAMMSAGFSMESLLLLVKDGMCLGRSALTCTWCLADWKSRSAWPKIEVRTALIIDLYVALFKIELQTDALYNSMKLLTNLIKAFLGKLRWNVASLNLISVRFPNNLYRNECATLRPKSPALVSYQ